MNYSTQMHSLNQHLLSSYCVPVSTHNIEDTEVAKQTCYLSQIRTPKYSRLIEWYTLKYMHESCMLL
jgi:hypothetical protein